MEAKYVITIYFSLQLKLLFELSIKNISYSILLTGITLLPFIHHHHAAYDAFCTVAQPPSWCSNLPPSIYSHVQATYWNVGFFRYWTLQQLPNFVIAAPPLLSLSFFGVHHLKHALLLRLTPGRNSKLPNERSTEASPTPSLPSMSSSELLSSKFLSPSLTPHAIHAIIVCSTLLLASHTQIVLRLSPSMPITYWSATWMLVAHPSWGRWWVTWSVIWGATSLILWGVFLPPA
jgi:GPI mannosyltransferase 2